MGGSAEVREGGCVVVVNGGFPSAELPLRLLKKAKTIVACDGAIRTLYEKSTHPDTIVGDLDSIPADLRKHYADRIHHLKDREINDLSKSIRFAHAQGYREVLILGAARLREDHTLGNISLLVGCAPLFKRVEMLSNYGLFTPVLETTAFASYPGRQISVSVPYPEGRLIQRDSAGPFANKNSPYGGRELSARLWEINLPSSSPRITEWSSTRELLIQKNSPEKYHYLSGPLHPSTLHA